MPKDLLTIDEAADILRVSSKTVYRKIHQLPGAFKVFGSWRVNRQILLAELEKMATMPKGESRVLGTPNRHGLV